MTNILRLMDYTQNRDNPSIYVYSYTDDVTTVTRSDGFAKMVNVESSESESVETTENEDIEVTENSESAQTTTTYEWDENLLIREKVTYNATNKTYDIWYFYDGMENILGYEYSYVNDQNEKTSTCVYYEKDLQGNVIGLLNDEGIEFATYSYDAWGKITNTTCDEGYEIAYNLNHIVYRGYYKDEESGFYYLQSRYYDPVTCRFINADDDVTFKNIGYHKYKDNMYTYCNSNPIINVDEDGRCYYNKNGEKWVRNEKGMLAEWNDHNALYNAFGGNHFKSVDLNNGNSWLYDWIDLL